MNATSLHSQAVRDALRHPTRGVVGLVDDLLTVCREQGLQLDWQADRCRVRAEGGEWEEVTDVALRPSVFRAILARVAALCNERTPNSVSPYGGHGELLASAPQPVVFQVSFANTPVEQTLALMPRTERAVPIALPPSAALPAERRPPLKRVIDLIGRVLAGRGAYWRRRS